jgi:hypothetical protein
MAHALSRIRAMNLDASVARVSSRALIESEDCHPSKSALDRSLAPPTGVDGSWRATTAGRPRFATMNQRGGDSLSPPGGRAVPPPGSWRDGGESVAAAAILDPPSSILNR